jgi:hypothetical protein
VNAKLHYFGAKSEVTFLKKEEEDKTQLAKPRFY